MRDILVYPQENVIPWGGVSYKGLVPSRSPVFVVEMNAHRCTTLQLCLSSRLVFRSDSDTNRENPKKERTRAAGVQFGAAHRGVDGAWFITNKVVPMVKALNNKS